MTLTYCTLERAHRTGKWALPPPYTYEWFHTVQEQAKEHTSSNPGTLTNLLAMVFWIAQRIPPTPCPLGEALPHAIRDVMAGSQCNASLASKHRRLYRAVNFAWFTVHQMIPAPLPVPPAPKQVITTPVVPAIITEEQVQRMCQVAEAHSLRYACFFRLLFTTGVRIGAVCRMQWKQFLHPSGEGMQSVVNDRWGARLRPPWPRPGKGWTGAVPLHHRDPPVPVHRAAPHQWARLPRTDLRPHGQASPGHQHPATAQLVVRGQWGRRNGQRHCPLGARACVEGHPHLARHYVAHHTGPPLPRGAPVGACSKRGIQSP